MASACSSGDDAEVEESSAPTAPDPAADTADDEAAGDAADDDGDAAGSGNVIRFINNRSIAPPGLAADQQGFFEAAGATVEFAELPTGTEAIAGMIGGSADFVLGGDARLLQAVAEDIDVVAVGIATTGYISNLAVPASDDTTESFEDLVGRSIGVEVGSVQHTGALRHLQAVGLDPDDFDFVNVPGADAPAALQGGAVSAAIFQNPFAGQSELSGISRIVMTPDEIAGPAGVMMPFMLFTTSEYIQSNPDDVQAFVQGWTCSKEWLGEDPQRGADILAEFFPDVDPAAVEAVNDVFTYDNHLVEGEILDDIDAQGETLVDVGSLESVPDYHSALDMSFVEAALEQGC